MFLYKHTHWLSQSQKMNIPFRIALLVLKSLLKGWNGTVILFCIPWPKNLRVFGSCLFPHLLIRINPSELIVSRAQYVKWFQLLFLNPSQILISLKKKLYLLSLTCLGHLQIPTSCLTRETSLIQTFRWRSTALIVTHGWHGSYRWVNLRASLSCHGP